MKTPQTHLPSKDQTMKSLFQKLFRFQIQLEEFKKECNVQEYEIDQVVQMIDQLMTQLLYHHNTDE